MSSLREFMRQQQQDQSTETITVRIPSSDLWKIDDLAASIDVTRQRMVYELIKEGLKTAENVSREEEEKAQEEGIKEGTTEHGKNYFILNTNKAHDPTTHQDMLTNGTAAAFHAPWKFNIQRLHRGDVVFLYESGRGIVATGIATGETEKVEYDGMPEEEYRQKLHNFRTVKPLSAKEIKQAVNANLIFYRTLISLTPAQGDIIEQELKKR